MWKRGRRRSGHDLVGWLRFGCCYQHSTSCDNFELMSHWKVIPVRKQTRGALNWRKVGKITRSLLIKDPLTKRFESDWTTTTSSSTSIHRHPPTDWFIGHFGVFCETTDEEDLYIYLFVAKSLVLWRLRIFRCQGTTDSLLSVRLRLSVFNPRSEINALPRVSNIVKSVRGIDFCR